MARLAKLPDSATIDKLAGKVDFYLWHGIAVARKWPVIPAEHLPQSVKDTWPIFKKINAGAKYAGQNLIRLYTEEASGHPLTWKDMLNILTYHGRIAHPSLALLYLDLEADIFPDHLLLSLTTKKTCFAFTNFQPLKPTPIYTTRIFRGIEKQYITTLTYDPQLTLPQDDPTPGEQHTFTIPLDPTYLNSWCFITSNRGIQPTPSVSPPFRLLDL